MADEKPSLHIDTDWKRQAQEEKRRLAEEEAKKAKEQVTTSAPSAASVGVGPASRAAAAKGTPGEALAASFAGLVQSMLTQILFYLGDLAARGQEPHVDLDMAKFQIDMLGVLEEKSKGNLTEEEQKLLDTALYETRMRYVSVASQFT
jgi:Domain of unknown function (DUF1844)